jgi:flotillin
MTLLYAIGGIAVLVILLVLLVLSRIKVAGPNQAFLVTGRQGRQVTSESGVISRDSSGQKVVMGASVFVLPVVQKLHTMDLSSRRIPVGIRGAVSKQGVKCDLEGVAIVKVGGSENSIRAAAQRFLNQQQGIDTFTSEVLAGALRSIVGRLTIEEIIRDRAAFASAVAEEAESSLTGQGLVLDTFQLQDIQAEGSYLADLGRPEAARVLKEASIAEARARQAAQQEQLLADEAIAISQRQLALKQAEIAAETDAAKARAAAAGPLAQAAQDQAILAEQEKVAVRTASLTERQLDTKVRRPADAERYRVEQEAEGRKNSAILARGQAEAKSMDARAEAFGTYGEAAILEMLVKVLPEVVGAAAAPLSAVDKMTVISADGAGSLGRSVAANVAQGLQLSGDLTGIDVAALLRRLGGAANAGVADGVTHVPVVSVDGDGPPKA